MEQGPTSSGSGTAPPASTNELHRGPAAEIARQMDVGFPSLPVGRKHGPSPLGAVLALPVKLVTQDYTAADSIDEHTRSAQPLPCRHTQ